MTKLNKIEVIDIYEDIISTIPNVKVYAKINMANYKNKLAWFCYYLATYLYRLNELKHCATLSAEQLDDVSCLRVI